MGSQMDSSDAAAMALDLDQIRTKLIRLEDTITFHLIERVQYSLNKRIYIPGQIKMPNPKLSFMDWYLYEQEKLQSLIRRYESPDEYPFFPEAVQTPLIPSQDSPTVLHPNDVCVNSEVRDFYVSHFLPAACPNKTREDRGPEKEDYGSSATADILCLQALSSRIHYGKYVAESKFRTEEEKFTRLIQAGDTEGIGAAITNKAVEQKVLARLKLKAQTYGTDPDDVSRGKVIYKIDADAVVSMYENFVIPLTKKVEVEYLMQRLKPVSSPSV